MLNLSLSGITKTVALRVLQLTRKPYAIFFIYGLVHHHLWLSYQFNKIYHNALQAFLFCSTWVCLVSQKLEYNSSITDTLQQIIYQIDQ